MGFAGMLRYVGAVLLLAGSAPNYFLIWFVWRGLSLVLPQWIYQVGDDFLYSLYQKMVVFIFEHCTGVKVFIVGDADKIFSKKENVLYIGNHQSTVDWVICNMLAIRQGSIGHLRYVMKDTLQMLPLYGHYFYQHGCIYVKRNAFKQTKMEKALDYLSDPKIKSWTVIFPEGTCFDPVEYDLIKKSLKAASDLGFEQLENHLTPRSKGTFLALSKLRGNLDAVYDVTCVYSGSANENKERLSAPQIVDFLLGKNKELHIHVRRIPIGEVPEDETVFKRWIHDLFLTKDKMVTQYYQEGVLEEGVDLNRVLTKHALPYTATAPSVAFFLCSFLPLVFAPWLRILWLKSIVMSTLIGYAWLAYKSVC